MNIKLLLAFPVLILLSLIALAQTPTYKELSATAYNLIKGQDYIGAHKAFHTMDSLYGISDFEALYYYYSLSHDFVPDFSWIPHEVAHQWWGNNIFFEYRDYALGESLTEYLKLQFLKSRKRGYREQMKNYKTMMRLATRRLRIAEIRSLDTQDETTAIYSAAPYRLEHMKTGKINTDLKRLYHKYKHDIVSRDTFNCECGSPLDKIIF